MLLFAQLPAKSGLPKPYAVNALRRFITVFAAGHTLRALGVRSVLNCTDDLADALIDAVPPFNFGRVPVEDTPETDIAATFEAASAFIADAIEGECEGEGGGKGGVLVHCFEGKSRSATIVAQHLVRATRRPLRACRVAGATWTGHASPAV